MRNPWLRLYRSSLHNPKIVTLSDRQHRAWHNCMLIADDHGRLPSLRDIAVHLRMTAAEAEQIIIELVEAQLIDAEVQSDGSRFYHMHDWSEHQYVSDSSTQRSRKCREKKKNDGSQQDATLQQRPSNGDATPPDTESETESEKLTTTSRIAAREARRDVKINLKIGSEGRAPRKRASLDVIARHAEGLGVNVAELREVVAKNRPDNPVAYFRSLCVKRLSVVVPQVRHEVISAALGGDSSATKILYGAILEGAT